MLIGRSAAREDLDTASRRNPTANVGVGVSALSDDCVNEAREGAAIRWWVTSKQEWNKLALIERFRDSPASLEIVTISDPP
jgi:hypothetical protein